MNEYRRNYKKILNKVERNNKKIESNAERKENKLSQKQSLDKLGIKTKEVEEGFELLNLETDKYDYFLIRKDFVRLTNTKKYGWRQRLILGIEDEDFVFMWPSQIVSLTNKEAIIVIDSFVRESYHGKYFKKISDSHFTYRLTNTELKNMETIYVAKWKEKK